MNNEIWVAILALVGTIFGSLMGKFSMTKMINYRIGILETKMDNLSNLIDRMNVAETKIDDIYNYVHKNYE